jgi:hypothetical protein
MKSRLKRESRCKAVMSSDLGTCWVTNRQFGFGRCSYVYACRRPERDLCEAIKVELVWAEATYESEKLKGSDLRRMVRMVALFNDRKDNLNKKFGEIL